MNESPKDLITSDEKMMAAGAHFFGTIAAFIVWALQRDKSRFVRFQALQAMSFDFFVMITMGLLFICGFGVIFLGMFGFLFTATNNASSQGDLGPFFLFPFTFPFLVFACVFPFSLLLTIVRIVASVSVLNGHDYRYPVLGRWIENFLDK